MEMIPNLDRYWAKANPAYAGASDWNPFAYHSQHIGQADKRMPPQYFKYWGKAGCAGEFHLLPYHALDVAACGKILLVHHRPLCSLLCARLGLDTSTLRAWLTFLLALHDLGKFSYRFQCLRQEFPSLRRNLPPANRYTLRHDSLGWLVWRESLQPFVLNAYVTERSRNRQMRSALSYWLGSAVGHHGQPPSTKRVGLTDHFTPDDQRAASEFCSAVGDLLLEGVQLDIGDSKVFAQAVQRTSWWLAGIAVLCDWLGSNRELFPYHTDALSLEQYWHDLAMPQAERAMRMSGVLPLGASACTQQELFQYLAPPTPLQRLANELPLGQTPQLLILEDVTGSGKTEAAVTAAHRIQESGAADGIYIGLPTMATSNAMHRRIVDKGLHEKLFTEAPAVVLTHGAARLMTATAPRTSVLPDAPAEGDYDKDEASAANLRAAWLSDHRKKALLADLGVGTIDQALLAVLPSRHQSLRLLGLARKVLIVDEVHAYDPYMQHILTALLRFQAYIGGHAILLSATLPRAMRQALVDAFRDGLERPAAPIANQSYPLLTRVDADAVQEIAVDTRPEVAREVQVVCIDQVQSALGTLLKAHHRQQCACWVRNSVDEAIGAWQQLQAAGVPAEQLMLFHARFALGDRLDIEKQVLTSFGPDSGPAERAGRILIATQVVEQSLDLDFDVMVTDLAPMDLIIQRAGRLRRHQRNTDGGLCEQDQRDQRGTPCLHLLTPAPENDARADWLAALLPKTARVYPDLCRLWRTARLLREHKAIRMPGAARDLIEGVYSENPVPAPKAIEDASSDAEGERMGAVSMANFNALKLSQGYTAPEMDYWDDIVAPTRLGEPTVRVRLARWHDGKLRPWRGDGDSGWRESELTVYQTWLAAEAEPVDRRLAEAIDQYLETVYDKGRWSRLLPLEPLGGGTWEGNAVDARGNPVRFDYDTTTGLRRTKEG